MKVEKIYSKAQFTTNYKDREGVTINKVEDNAKNTESALSPNPPKRSKNLKNIILYVIILIIGLVLGKILFSNSEQETLAPTAEASAEEHMWTCSMHPQIMQPNQGDCPLCGMDLIVAEKGADGLSPDQFKLTQNAIALANIQTTTVGGTVLNTDNSTISLSGKIVVNQEVNAVQVSHIAGRIEHLYINFEGENVSRGQQLASVYSPELFSAQQELLTAVSLKQIQPELYNAVRNKLKLWKLTDAQIHQIELSNTIQENLPIYATESGTVTQKLVNKGDYIAKGQPLLELANYKSVWADFDIYENQISHFKIGQTITVKANAYPEQAFKAKVTFIDPVLDTNKRTVTLRTVLNNSANILKPGMFISGVVQLAKETSKEETIIVPSSAVIWTGKRSIVYVKSSADEPVFEMREVLIGNSTGSTYEILGGLKNGEEIVTNGVFTIDASAQLLGKRAMMNHTKKTIEMPKQRIEVASKFKKQLNTLVNSYIIMKDALIEHDSITVFKTSEQVNNDLKNINEKLLKSDNSLSIWSNLKTVIEGSVDTIGKTTNLKIQRKQFKVLSAHLIEAVETFGTTRELYNQYCPMADNDTGGHWLSNEEKILNPYFGDMMLSCGEVKQTID